jgi:HSP20 family molecular chaperone IbpA
VDPGALTATYKDGILEVRVPWADDAKTTPIKVPINQS